MDLGQCRPPPRRCSWSVASRRWAVGAGVAFIYNTRLEAKTAQLATAVEKTNQALDKAEFFRYFQNIALANAAWRDGNMGRLEQLLDGCPV